MKKRVLSIIMAIALLLGITLFHVSAKEISVLVNDKEITFDVSPIIINDRTMVPMRKIFEVLNYNVYWEQSTQKITAIGEQGIIIMYVGNYYLTKNGDNISIDTPPQICSNRTLVPLRAISEALDCEVLWDDGTVFIRTKEYDSSTTQNNNFFQNSSVLLSDVDNIGYKFSKANANHLIDNYGNVYSEAFTKYFSGSYTHTFETLLNMNYKKFKATFYVAKGTNSTNTKKVVIKADEKIIYTSPEITNTSRPIYVDINIIGCNDFKIDVTGDVFIGDAVFYK